MAKFKQSRLVELLDKEQMLSDKAWAFVDACTDDWDVDETEIDGAIHYEIRGMQYGYFRGEMVEVTVTYCGKLTAIACLLEARQWEQSLKMEYLGRMHIDES